MPNENEPYDPFAGLEAWKNTGEGKFYVQRFTGKYGETSYEAVHGGRVFHVSPAERRLNSEKCRLDERDPFKNGTLIPLALPESTPPEDRAAIESNPETMSDEQIVALFKGRGPKAETALAEKLGEVTNLITLARIHEAAVAADLPFSKIGLIVTRITEMTAAPKAHEPGTPVLDPEGRLMVAGANALDSPQVYGNISGADKDIQSRRGVADVTVGGR